MRVRTSVLLVGLCMPVWNPLRLLGQFVRTGSIDGQVLDSSNAGVPGALVTATSVATSQKTETYTDSGGR
jgi:hypothetical protein